VAAQSAQFQPDVAQVQLQCAFDEHTGQANGVVTQKV
jgi:hypothetical protein